MDPQPTREKLLEAAARIFLEHGYSAASMDQVRQAAGVSNGSLYHHFPTKAQLAEALYAELLRDFHGSLLRVLAPDPAAEAGVKGLVHAYAAWVLRHPDRARLLHRLKRDGDVTDASEAVSAANAEVFGRLEGWIERKCEQGEMRELPLHLWMALVFAPSMSLTGRWVRDARASIPAKTRAALEHAAWMAVAP